MAGGDDYVWRGAPGGGLTYREWHLFWVGVGAGLREATRPETAEGEDRWYWSGGYLVGFLVRYGAFVALALALGAR